MGDKTPSYRTPQQRLSGAQISPTQEVAASEERKILVCKENLIFLASSTERDIHIYFTYEVMNLLKYGKLEAVDPSLFEFCNHFTTRYGEWILQVRNYKPGIFGKNILQNSDRFNQELQV